MLDKQDDAKGGKDSWTGLLARLAKLSRQFSQSALPDLFFREAIMERAFSTGRTKRAGWLRRT